MKQFLAFVLSVAINAAALGSLQNIGSGDTPKGEVFITELGSAATPAQLAALTSQAG
jgi:hypothetical protein